MSTPIELAREHLAITATTDARDRRERSSAIAVAAAAVAQAEAMVALTAAIVEQNDLNRDLVEQRVAGSADGIRDLLKPAKSKATGEGAIG